MSKTAQVFTLTNGRIAQAFVQVDADGTPVNIVDLEQRLAVIEAMLNIVDTYDDLPDANDHYDEFWMVKHDGGGKQAGIYGADGHWKRVVKFTNWN